MLQRIWKSERTASDVASLSKHHVYVHTHLESKGGGGVNIMSSLICIPSDSELSDQFVAYNDE